MNKINIKDLKLIHKGKVRDIYAARENLVISTSDRISAFDQLMNDTIPDKGRVLNQTSKFWLKKTKHIIQNHFISDDVASYPPEFLKYSENFKNRSMLIKKTKPFPIEFVVRGYIVGSAWEEYKTTGQVCGHKFDTDLKEFSKFPKPIFTPATKNSEGHDENITYAEYAEIIGEPLAQKLKGIAIELFNFASNYLAQKGLILADTKFEFGQLEDGSLLLIDEALTPDSSRIWDAEDWKSGSDLTKFDKQILRNYLKQINWKQEDGIPKLPKELIEQIAKAYKIIYNKITG